MARRKQRHLIDPTVTFGLLIALGVIWLIAQNLRQLSYVFAIGIGLIILLVGASQLRRRNASRTLLQKAQKAVEEQLRPLVRKKAQLVRKDEYGVLQVKKWEVEKDRFITQHVDLSLSSNERSALQRERKRIAELIDACVEVATQNQPVFQRFSEDMTPPEFEVFCAEELCRAGWDARVTKQSRDQGADVVAEKGDMRIVIQCKLHSQPVGNKSVQEIVAAKAHYQARYGVVVTNSRYTQAAEQLASTNGIWLLHFSDLQNLHNLLGKE